MVITSNPSTIQRNDLSCQIVRTIRQLSHEFCHLMCLTHTICRYFSDQFFFFLFAILVAIISFGLERIDGHKEYNYLDEENKTVARLVNNEQQPVTQTPEGIAL